MQTVIFFLNLLSIIITNISLLQGFLAFSKMQRLNQFSRKIFSRPVSILPVTSNIFERLIFKQLIMFFEPVFSKYQSGFWKGLSAQHCLLTITENWKKCLDSNGACGALLTDFSKAFDSLPHSLLIAKLDAYGFDKTSIEYLKDYLSHRKQNIQINKTFSNWTNILHVTPTRLHIGSTTFYCLSL